MHRDGDLTLGLVDVLEVVVREQQEAEEQPGALDHKGRGRLLVSLYPQVACKARE